MALRSWRSLFSGRLLLLTNTVSCGGLLAAGDCLQQEWQRRKHPESQLQLGRTGRMFAVGCSLGPLLHYWYLWLDAAFPARGVRGLRTVLKKVLIDQLVASPSMGAWYFMGRLERVAGGADPQLPLRAARLPRGVRQRGDPGLGHLPVLPQTPAPQPQAGATAEPEQRRRLEREQPPRAS
ncbi:mpv17-like protein 2 isoform X3 [Passer montanus]|uniref:mpv17-like protein 2 isoform X3 n=1 Tax=Passer montanus TaxID=9160 RepID=UPI00196091AF|nr:mpv17-like protein 2 isoform X3 [Passer montanus]